jgi:two-component system LytT family response regulator
MPDYRTLKLPTLHEIGGRDMTFTCLVLDDDQIHCDLMREVISERSDKLFLAGTYTNPQEARQHLEHENIDMLFVDMEMPLISGIDFVKQLKDPPLVIYITSHPEFAMESYEVEATDYLIKPLNQAAFDKGVAKAIKRIETRKKAKLADSMIDAINHEHDYFVIRTDARYVKIKYKDVIYIEAFSDFVKIHTPSELFIHLSNLKNIEGMLPPSIFIRTHRSYIINTRYVDSLSGSEIKIGDSIVPIGESYKENVISQIVGNKLVRR